VELTSVAVWTDSVSTSVWALLTLACGTLWPSAVGDAGVEGPFAVLVDAVEGAAAATLELEAVWVGEGWTPISRILTLVTAGLATVAVAVKDAPTTVW
jgi:hypothetical protein